MKKPIAALLGLLLLLACTQQGDPTDVPTETSTATDTPVATQTPSPIPVLPTPLASLEPEPSSEAEGLGLATVGKPLTYTLTVANRGPSDATGVLITDTLPAGAIFVSATSSQGAGCQVSDFILCALGDLSPRASATITIVVIPITMTRTITHSAIAAANETDPDALNNIFFEETAISPATDLAIQARTSDPIVAGGTAIYTFTIINHGPATATGLVLTGVLPIGITPLWTSPAEPVCGRQARTAGCDMGEMRGGSAATVTLDLSVHGTDTLVTGTQLAGVSIDLSEPTCSVGREGILSYVTCLVDNLEDGARAHVRVGVSADAGITGTFTHTATVLGREADPNLANNHAAITSTLGAASPVTVTGMPTTAADLAIHVDAPDRVIAGKLFTYTLTITNKGSLDATGVTLQDILPPGIILHSITPGWPACHASDGAITCQLQDPHSSNPITFTLITTSDAESPPAITLDPLMPGWPLCKVDQVGDLGRAVNCTLGQLAGGAGTRITFVALPGGVMTRTITNTVSVQAHETEINSSNNATDTITIVGVEADLAIRSEVSGLAVAGEILSYTLTISNVGPSDSTRVLVTDTLPSSVTLVSALATQGNDCQQIVTGTVTCRLGTLHSGEAAAVTIVVNVDDSVDPSAIETLINLAIAIADQPDPNRHNNEATEATPVSVKADLSIMEP